MKNNTQICQLACRDRERNCEVTIQNPKDTNLSHLPEIPSEKNNMQ